MKTALELSDRTTLTASFRENEFSFMIGVGKPKLTISDECLYYCMKCIEQSTDNTLGYNIEFDFKTSRIMGDVYVDRATKICKICKLFQIMNPGLFDYLQEKFQDDLRTKSSVCKVLSSMLVLMFEDAITWAKIVALFAFTGALVVECILQGNCKYVVNIMYLVKQFMESELVVWIAENNGWVGMLQHFQSLHVKTPEGESDDGSPPDTKTCLRQKVINVAKHIVYYLRDTLVSSKYLMNSVDDCDDVVRRPKKRRLAL